MTPATQFEDLIKSGVSTKVDLLDVYEKFREQTKEALLEFCESHEEMIQTMYHYNRLSNCFLIGLLTGLSPEARRGVEFYVRHLASKGISPLDYDKLALFLGIDFDIIKALEDRKKQREHSQRDKPETGI